VTAVGRCAAPGCPELPTWTVRATSAAYAVPPVPVCESHRDELLRSLAEQNETDPSLAVVVLPW
jgi:hypothetical protein